MLFTMSDYDMERIWQDVPTPQPQVAFLVDPVQEDEFTVVAHTEVAGFDVGEVLYDIDGVWRVTQVDTDDHPEMQSAVFEVVIDRRYKAEEVREAVIKLLNNLYAQI